MELDLANRKRVEPFVSSYMYWLSINDPNKVFTDIIINEMEKKIGEILEKKEKEEIEKKKLQGKKKNGVFQSKEPDYGWLKDVKLKERKKLSYVEYSHVNDLIEKLDQSEWVILVDFWGWELSCATTRSEVLTSFEENVTKIIANRLQISSTPTSVEDVVISMKQLMDNEESQKKDDFETSSINTSYTTLSFDTLITSSNESIQLQADAMKKFNKVMNIV